ncbi:MAG: paraquat-inducible protein A [Nitrospira sp.]|nr:paraquat-inducible protein A [Nitrospira sp.]
MDVSELIACPDCDCLQRRVPLPLGGEARCSRCEAVLYRSCRNGMQHTLAYAVAGLFLFLIANVYPIAGIEMQGHRQAASLYDAVSVLWQEGHAEVAVLVGLTTIVSPSIQIGLVLFLLVPLHFNYLIQGAVPVLRILETVRPWSMMEVFFLGIVVSLFKLEQLAQVEIGVALWAFAAMVPILIVGGMTFDPDEIWEKVRALS